MLDSNIKFEKMFRFIHGSEIYFYNQFHIINKENWKRYFEMEVKKKVL